MAKGRWCCFSESDFEDKDPFGDESQSSKIRASNFNDEDPFGDLSNYQSDSKSFHSETASFRVCDSGAVSDKVRPASAVYSQLFDCQNRGAGVSISDSISDPPSSFEIQILDDDDECQSSKLRGPDFEDPDLSFDEIISIIRGSNFKDKDPFGDLSNYQSDSKKSSFRVLNSGAVSDKVRVESAFYSQLLDHQNHGAGVSISDSISDSPPSSEIQILLCNAVGTLRSELVLGWKDFKKIQLARYVPLHPKEMIRNIFLGNPNSLEVYKSLTDKKAILEEALAIGDGNVILTVSFMFSPFAVWTLVSKSLVALLSIVC